MAGGEEEDSRRAGDENRPTNDGRLSAACRPRHELPGQRHKLVGARMGEMIVGAEKQHSIGLLSLVVVGFFWVSGGMYGNEPLGSTAPAGIVLCVTLAAPLLFALPLALVAAEMGTALPEDGGMVVPVERAFGVRVGSHNSWWCCLSLMMDACLYPMFFAEYALATAAGRAVEQPECPEPPCPLIGDEAPVEWVARGIAWALMLVITALNLRGIDWLLRLETVLGVLSLGPCLVFVGWAAPGLKLEGSGSWRDFGDGTLTEPNIDRQGLLKDPCCSHEFLTVSKSLLLTRK